MGKIDISPSQLRDLQNGTIFVRIRDLESVNFDKICCLALKAMDEFPETLATASVKVAPENGPCHFDLEGESEDREYWKVKGRSMTELYAIRTGLGKADATGVVCVESEIPGLVALCQALAENHGKVSGVKGGALYKRGTIPTYARNIALLPHRASELVERIVKAVAASLKEADPIKALFSSALLTDGGWDEVDDALSAAERAVYEIARDTARALHEGRCAGGTTFALAKATGSPAPEGIAIATANPNLMKHLWAALKSMDRSFKVAVAVVSNPATKRVAVLCSTQFDADIGPAAKALKERFPEAEFDVNVDRNSIVWDPRSKAPGPTAEQVKEIVSSHFAFRTRQPSAVGPRFGAKLADVIRHGSGQNRR